MKITSTTRKNSKNSAGYSHQTSKILDFLYTKPQIMVTWQALRADKVSKIVLKVVQEDFGNTSKNHLDCICRFFSQIFFRLGGGTTSLDAINR